MRAIVIGILAVGAGAALAGAGSAETPARIWQGVAQVNVACLIETERGVDSGPLHERVCRAARAAVADGAPMPVHGAGIGDPSTLRADVVTLLVHGWSRPQAGGRIVAISTRPYRNLGDDPGQLFTGAPRAALIRDDADPALDGIVRETVRPLLPWGGGAGTTTRP